MKIFFYSMLAFMFLFLFNACGLAVVTAVQTVRGGDGQVLIVEPVQDLQIYNTISIKPFTVSLGEHSSQDLPDYITRKFKEVFSSNGISLAPDGQLHMSGSIIYMSDGFLDKQIIVQIKLKDASRSDSMGVVNVTGKALGLRGIHSAADAVVEEVTGFLSDYNFSGALYMNLSHAPVE